MELDGKTVIFLAAPFLIIALFVTAAYYISFDRGLSDAERGMLDFRQAELTIRKPGNIFTTKAGQGPFEFSATGDEAVANDTAPQHKRRGLSLIVVSEDKKMAMIGDRLVKEGDRIDDKKIAKIEPDRILVRDRTLKWEYLREE
jgi:hypothetical protein